MGKISKIIKLPRSIVISLLISLYSVTLAFFDPSASRIICFFAMLTSTLGDVILSDYKPIVSRLPLRGFIAGGSVFAVAHALYILAFLWQIVQNGYAFLNAGAYFGIAIFVIIAVYLTFVCIKNRIKARLTAFAFIYLILITFNCTCVFSLASCEGGIKIISAIGAFSFLISDLIIALDVFCGIRLPHRSRLIWIFYPIGQILLLFGA